jgi:hypothetical protein
LTADLETTGEGAFAAAVDLPAGEYQAVVTKPNYAEASLSLRIPLERPLARCVANGR